ncbi:hypothetical protein FM037_24655 [Shewanella psychropiezotolerans]|uniref:Phospholipid/glycerol acyltransferase domain-containing protein n=2 Tax=Shewanella psychropiezotolerans TaxID=2593655 RepID=A0ABX5X692_9GAMM|nr:hypothetical protein FM037_24655 [Shewanella psychropiezotolerans]
MILISVIFISMRVDANTTAKIAQILMYEQGNIIYIYPEGGVNNPPACHGSNGDYLSYKMDRPMAKEYLSMLMLAFAAQKVVSFRTAGACVDQSVSETILYFTVYK